MRFDDLAPALMRCAWQSLDLMATLRCTGQHFAILSGERTKMETTIARHNLAANLAAPAGESQSCFPNLIEWHRQLMGTS